MISEDVWRYLWDARVQAAGVNPYRFAPVDPVLGPLRDEKTWPRIGHKEIPTIYGPSAQVFFAFSARIGLASPRGLRFLFFLLEIPILWRLRREPLYLFHPLLLFEGYIEGHIDFLAMAAVGGAIWAAEGRRDFSAGFLWGLACLVKFFPLAFTPILLVAERQRGKFLAGLLLAFGVFLPYLSGGTGLGEALRTYGTHWSFNGFLHPLLGVDGWQGLPGLPFVRKETLRAAWLVLGCGAALSIGLAVRSAPRGILLGWGTFLLFSPTIYSWYWMPLLPLVSFARPLGRAERALFALTFTVLLSHAVLLSPAAGAWEPPFAARLLEFGIPGLFLLMRFR